MESLIFIEDGKDTFTDFSLIPVKKIVFESPKTKTNFVDITGSDNSLDLSEALTGYPVYYDREGSFKFRFYDDGMPVRIRLTKLMNFLHGKRKLVIISDEPDWYYDARWEVVNPQYKKVGEFADVEISYIAKAYKRDITGTTEDWLWDPFNFETGVIREYGDMEIPPTAVSTAPVSIQIIGSRMPTVPKFIVEFDESFEGTGYVQFGEKVYELVNGTNMFADIVLMQNEYEFEFYCETTSFENAERAFKVSVDFRGGSL